MVEFTETNKKDDTGGGFDTVTYTTTAVPDDNNKLVRLANEIQRLTLVEYSELKNILRNRNIEVLL